MVNIISKNRKTASNIMFSIILMGILICSTICSPVFASTVFSDSSSVSGYIPAFIDTSHLRDKSYEIKDPISSNANRMLKNTSSISSLDIPSYYDNRDKLIEPGNQREFGACWVFAGMGAIEATLAVKGVPANLSEWHQLYWNFHDYSDELYSFNAIGNSYYMGGGNLNMVNAILTRGTGAANESKAPYPGDLAGYNSASTQIYTPAYLPREYVIRGAYVVADPGGRGSNGISPELVENAKRAVMDYGGIAMSIYQDDSYLSSSYGYYTDKVKGTANHVIVIVGWDDNFSASNFKENCRPPVDGAWICRNSYGSSWGDDGYYYVSYAERTLDGGYVYSVEKEDPKLEILTYDPLGPTSFVGDYSSDSIGFGNIFTAKKDTELVKTAFYTNEANLKCQIEVYKNCNGNPVTGTLISAFEQIIPTPGYNTVDLPESVPIKGGETFSIVVKIKDYEYTGQIPIMYIYGNYYVSGKAKAEPGHSFYMTIDEAGQETWEDAAQLNSVFGDSPAAVSLRAIIRYEKPLYEDIGPGAINLRPGESTTISYNAGITWSSANSNIATVTQDGVVTAHNKGNTYIKAVRDGAYDYIFIRVTDNGDDIETFYWDSGSSGGCNMGLGVLGLIMIAPIIFKSKRKM